MRIKKSSITRCFCIAPKSWVDSQAAGRSSPLDAFFGQEATPTNWSVLLGVRPDSIDLAQYVDDEPLNLCRPLFDLGIFTDPSDLKSTDPSVYFRSFTLGDAETNANERTIFIGFAYQDHGADQTVTQAREPVSIVIDEFPKPTAIAIRTCRDLNQERVSHAIESLLSRFPQMPADALSGIKINADISQEVDRQTLLPTGTDSLPPASVEELRKHFPNGGINGVLIRHSLADTAGREVLELLVYWSKSRATVVRQVIPDLQQL